MPRETEQNLDTALPRTIPRALASCTDTAVSVWWGRSSVAASPMVADMGRAVNLGATRWFFFPLLGLLLLPHPHPHGRPTPGSAGPAQRCTPPGLSCYLYRNQSPPCTGAHHPVLRWCCCSCICHGSPWYMDKKERRRRKGRKHKGDTRRGGDTEKGHGERKRKWKVTHRKE